jgi:hypothetical protein
MFWKKKKQKVTSIDTNKVKIALNKNEVYDAAYKAFRGKKKYTVLDENVFNFVKNLIDENYAELREYPNPIDTHENPAADGTINWNSTVMGWKKSVHPYVRMVLASKGIFIPTLQEMSESVKYS